MINDDQLWYACINDNEDSNSSSLTGTLHCNDKFINLYVLIWVRLELPRVNLHSTISSMVNKYMIMKIHYDLQSDGLPEIYTTYVYPE